MTALLNDNLYKRFGLEVDVEQVRLGFCKFLKNTALKALSPIVYPDAYQGPEELREIQQKTLEESCRQMFKDRDRFDNRDYGFIWFIENILDSPEDSFEKYLVNLQILVNILSEYKAIKFEVDQFTDKIAKYFSDFPVLGLTLKIYKIKPAQILPFISKAMNMNIENTLNILEPDKYKAVIKNYEEGLKEFLFAKKESQLKDAIEDMYTACDEMAKIVLKNKNKGFKHIFKNKDYEKVGITSKHLKELFRNLKDFMDNIKHGTIKKFDRHDVEIIINTTSSFLRFLANKNS